MGQRIDYLDEPDAPKATSVVPSANVIVVNDQDEILMIRRTDNDNWAVPGGGMDPGESITETAVRETEEETGITCEITGLTGIYTNPRHVILYTSNGEVRQEFSIVFTARPVGGQLRPSSESAEPQWVRRDDDSRLDHASVNAPAHPALPRQPAPALPRLISQQLLNPPSRREDLGSSTLDELSHLVIGAIPAADLHQPVGRPYIVTVRAGRHVAVEQNISEQRVSRLELSCEILPKPSDISLDLSAGMISNQANDLAIDANATKVAGAIKRMKARLDQLGRVADVMQPGSRHQIRRQREPRRDPPRTASDRADVHPSAGQHIREIALGQITGGDGIRHAVDRTHKSPSPAPRRDHRQPTIGRLPIR